MSAGRSRRSPSQAAERIRLGSGPGLLGTERIVRLPCEAHGMDGPPVVPPKFHLAQSDAVAWLRALPSESIDLVITDPPYESLEKHRAIGTTTRLKHSKSSSNDWFSIFPNARFP